MPPLTFSITHRDTASRARLGRVTTPHGAFDTPAFMPVGTQATIKGLRPDQVAELGTQIILANTYHLLLRPGAELVARHGGLHPWMRWPRPILTDSGGYQVFSLADISRINDDGVTFRSHVDGAYVELTPERAMRVQNELGADIVMAFDDCPPATSPGRGPQFDRSPGREPGVHGGESRDPSPERRDSAAGNAQLETHDSQREAQNYAARVQQANERTLRWLERCVRAHARPADQALFGIVQGGTDLEQRTWCVQRVCAHDLPGYAIGGVAVGEGPEAIRAVVEHTAALLPEDRPRYLMGVGYERDIVAAVRAGVDMFDCVLPTRNGRNAYAFTRTGSIRLRNARFRDDPAPIEADCDCPACGGGFSRSYLRHLFMAEEMLGPILVSLHNLRHYQRLMLDIRGAIAHNDWSLVESTWPVAAPAGDGSRDAPTAGRAGTG